MLTSSGVMMHVNCSSVHECLEVLSSFMLTELMVCLESFFFCSLSLTHVRYYVWVSTPSSPVEGKQFVMSVNIVGKFTPFWVIEMM